MSREQTNFSKLSILIIGLLTTTSLLTATSLFLFNRSETKDYILDVQRATDLQKHKPAFNPLLDRVDFNNDHLSGAEVESVKSYFKDQSKQIQPLVDFDSQLFNRPSLDFLNQPTP